MKLIAKLKPTLKIIKKILLGFFALAAILVCLLVAVVATETGSRWVVTQTANHYEIVLGEVHGNLLQGFDIASLDWQKDQLDLHAKNISFRWQPLGLLYTSIKLQSFSADELVIHHKQNNQIDENKDWPSFSQPFLIELNQIHIKHWVINQNEKIWSLNETQGALSLGAFNLQIKTLTTDVENNHFDVKGKIATRFPYDFDINASVQWNQPKIFDHSWANEINLKGDLLELAVKTKSALPGEKNKLEEYKSEENKPKENKRAAEDYLALDADIKTGIAPEKNKLTQLIKNKLQEKNIKDKSQEIQHPIINVKLQAKVQHLNDYFATPAVENIQALELNSQFNIVLDKPFDQLTQLNIKNISTQASAKVSNQSVTLNSKAELPIRWNAQQLTGNLQIEMLELSRTSSVDKNSTTKNATEEDSHKVQGHGALAINFEWQNGVEPTAKKVFLLKNLSSQLQFVVHNFSIDTWQKEWLKTSSNSNDQFPILKTSLDGGWLLVMNYQPDSGVEGQLSDIKLNGKLADQPFNLMGAFAWKNSEIKTADVTSHWGNNEFQIKADAAKQQILWQLKIPELSQLANLLHQPLQGSIVSSGNITTTFKQPVFDIQLSAKDFSWRELSLAQLDMDITSATKNLDAKGGHQFKLDAKNIVFQNNEFESFAVTGDGRIEQHQLRILLKQNKNNFVQASMNAGWFKSKDKTSATSQWRGDWKSLLIHWENFPQWQFMSAQPFVVNVQKIDIPNICMTMDKSASASTPENNVWSSLEQTAPENFSAVKKTTQGTKYFGANTSVATDEKSAVCLQGQFNFKPHANGNLWAVHADILGLPANLMNQWTKVETHWLGFIDGNADVWQKPSADIAANINFASRDVQLVYQFQDEHADTYKIESATLALALKNKQWTEKTDLDFGRYGFLRSQGTYALSAQKIQASLEAELKSIAPFESLMPALNNLEGEAVATINVSGHWQAPKISGLISLENGSATVPSLGLSLSNMQLHAKSQGEDGFHLDARATSGDGTLVVNGSLENFGQENWRWDSNVFGANIRAIENPLLSATINPNLRLQATRDLVSLTGSTEIPWARASLKSLPASATRLSKDVVLINSNQQNNLKLIKKSGANNGSLTEVPSSIDDIPLYTNVILYFGDDVRFKGFGLDSQLLGKINVLKEKNRQTFTTGFVGVGEGQYKAYGQELKIERGRLIFQGPYDNPGLDIRALRELDNVSAGLEIGGTLQRPKSTVFSVPASTPSEAMALLVTGKPLAQSSQADAYALLGAISSLGMDQEESMSTDIAHKFSLDEMGIKADKGIEQSSLWVGKYVTPKLFIRYVVGLFDQAFSVGMRYQLSDKFRLEAESGKLQSIDVIYKIER